MRKTRIHGLTLFFKAEDQDTITLFQQACEKSIPLIQEHYGLDTPKDCRVYIMTSWITFIFHSAPWPWKVLLAVTMPLWAIRTYKTWLLAGGWEQRFGQRKSVGVKPPRLLRLADIRIGDKIFVRRKNVGEKVQGIICHELTHAFTSHLQMPIWLKEGLAMVMVDKFFEEPTVRHETLRILERTPNYHYHRGHQKLRAGDEDALVDLYVRGYWLTRYLDETQPGLLKDFLSKRYQYDEFEREIATAAGKGLEGFWGEIDEVLVSHFNQKGDTS